MMQQWIRQCGLLIVAGSETLDLSRLRITFEVKRTQSQTPNLAQIKVYNLSEDTANLIVGEGSRIILQAGYQDNFGVVFDGQCIQIKKGREDGTETYVEINASDGDHAYNYSFVNTTLIAGSTQKDHVATVQKAMGVGSTQLDTTAKPLPRGKVMFGEAKRIMRKSAHANNQDWSIQDGQLQIINSTSTLKQQAVVLNSKSGLVGGAEQSTNGIKARALLNPMIKIGGLIQLDEQDVAFAKIHSEHKQEEHKKKKKSTKTSKKHAANKPASIAHDGKYKVIEVSYIGDTYGNDWYSDAVCIELSAVKAGKDK